MQSKWIIPLAIAAAFLGSEATAHHSFSATYNTDESITIRGQIVQFMFRNPHSFVHVMAPDDSGEMQRWAIEWGGAGQLAEQGMTRATLKPGDEVVITGSPSRNPDEHRMRMNSLVRPQDGYSWGERGETVR